MVGVAVQSVARNANNEPTVETSSRRQRIWLLEPESREVGLFDPRRHVVNLKGGPRFRSMKFTVTQDFPAGLDRLWGTFGRPAYVRQKYLALGATAVRLNEFRSTTQVIEVDLERDVPVDLAQLPAWMRSLIGREQTLQHRTQWRRVNRMQVTAEIDVSPVGLPVRAHGVGRIVETATGATRMELEWRVQSALPVVGARVELLFADQVRAALAEDHQFTLKYLQQTPAGGTA